MNKLYNDSLFVLLLCGLVVCVGGKFFLDGNYFLLALTVGLLPLALLMTEKRFVLVFILFTLFFLKFSSHSDTFMDRTMRYANAVIAGAALYYLVREHLLKHTLVNKHVAVTCLVFPAIMAASTVFNEYSFYFFSKTVYIAFSRVFISFLLILLLTEPKDLKFFVSAYLVLATVSLAVTGLFQLYLGERIIKAGEGHHNYFTADSSRLSGFVDADPISSSSALLFLCVICLSCFLAKGTKGYLFGFVLNSLALILTFSRSAYVLASLATLFILWVGFKRAWRTTLRPLAYLLCLMAGVYFFCVNLVTLPSPGIELMNLSSSFETRRVIWMEAPRIAFKYLLGYSPLVTGSLENVRVLGYECSFENMYLEWFYQTGIIGAAFFLYFASVTLHNYFKAYRLFSGGRLLPYRMWAAGFGTAFGCFLLHGLAFNSSVFSHHAWVFWSFSFALLNVALKYGKRSRQTVSVYKGGRLRAEGVRSLRPLPEESMIG